MSHKVEQTAPQYLDRVGKGRQHLYDRVRRILDRLPDAELEDLPAFDDLGLLGEIESRLASRAPGENALARALLRGNQARKSLMKTTAMLTVDQAAELLGIQPDSVRKRIQRGGLIAVKPGQSVLLPAFQFRDNQVVDGLGECLAALPLVGDWTRLDWFMMPHPDLEDKTPAECLRHAPDQVVAVAKRFGRQGGA